MDDLLPYYERELLLLRRQCREFAEQHPQTAERLGLGLGQGADASDDPQVERLIQSVALLTARLARRLDDSYPQFTTPMLENTFPHLLRPVPSCAIAQLAPCAAQTAKMSGVSTLARGTELESALVQEVRCKFTTLYDLHSAPISLSAARFEAYLNAPGDIVLPAGAAAGISLTLAATVGNVALAGLALDRLRVHIDGEPSFCAALRDTLFMRVVRAYVDTGDGHWTALPAVPLAPVGFDEQDGLIPFGARPDPAYRLLGDYFSFPEKFNFFDIDLTALRARLPEKCDRFTLHLALSGLRADSPAARILGPLSERNLLLGCSPVVNLFQRRGEPIAVTQMAADFAVQGHANTPQAYAIYSIDSVWIAAQRGQNTPAEEVRPYYALRHGEGASHYWIACEDGEIGGPDLAHRRHIRLVGIDGTPKAVDRGTLSITLSCTNGGLCALLNPGDPHGALALAGADSVTRAGLLGRPTPACAPLAAAMHWRAVSQLTLNQHTLHQEGLPALRQMLSLHDLRRSPLGQRQVDGMVGLSQQPSACWARIQGRAWLMHGVEIRVTLDEDAYTAGGGVHLFVQILEAFLGLYLTIGSFIELCVLSKQSGGELIRCKPRTKGVARLVR